MLSRAAAPSRAAPFSCLFLTSLLVIVACQGCGTETSIPDQAARDFAGSVVRVAFRAGDEAKLAHMSSKELLRITNPIAMQEMIDEFEEKFGAVEEFRFVEQRQMYGLSLFPPARLRIARFTMEVRCKKKPTFVFMDVVNHGNEWQLKSLYVKWN
jgi:hypothetical protein